MLHVYISVTVLDSQNSYFLYINNERIWIWLIFRDGWRLCLEYPSSYSRQPRLGLATYSLFIVASPRLGLATYSLFIVASPRLGLATYSLFASLVYLFVLLSVSRLTQKRLRLGLRNFACCLLMCFSRSLLILVLIGER